MESSAGSVNADCKEEGSLHLENSASPETKEIVEEGVHLTFCTCSGRSGTLSVEHDLMAGELKARVEVLLGIPAGFQQWLVACGELKVADGLSVASLNLKSGDCVTVIHSGFVPLQPLPNAFSWNSTLSGISFALNIPAGLLPFIKFVCILENDGCRSNRGGRTTTTGICMI